ncbi:unnamed protein product [Penicillium egyptiacum]|uniref:Vacuolar ATPase assembly integral membrane protein VMA21 n=1 Tax=Penicillium egyptiacum TaxID=1303716 RepID=A0A9W4KFK4_9EURO|nr:unnamed protein product [Penicillium egyptiacum]
MTNNLNFPRMGNETIRESHGLIPQPTNQIPACDGPYVISALAIASVPLSFNAVPFLILWPLNFSNYYYSQKKRMSARRPHNQSYADVAVKPAPQDTSDVAPAVPADVIYKLLGFTAAMIVGPIGMYFLTVNSIFSGSSTLAGITAAVTANVVLFAYIYVAWTEDKEDRQAASKSDSKKAQ